MTPKSIFAAVLVFLPIPALAQTFDASGVWTYTSENEVHPVADDLVAIHVVQAYESFEPVSPDYPLPEATGRCFGAFLIRAGQASGSGYCHIVDTDGDMFISEWIVEGLDAERMITGSWSVIDGSGKYSGASGSGTYRSGEDASGIFENEVTGEITLN